MVDFSLPIKKEKIMKYARRGELTEASEFNVTLIFSEKPHKAVHLEKYKNKCRTIKRAQVCRILQRPGWVFKE